MGRRCRSRQRRLTLAAAPELRIAPGMARDVPAILGLIRQLADYEKLAGEAVATEQQLREHLFGPRPAAETLIARAGEEAVGFALFFPSFSTFVGRPGIYLEDLFVIPEWRGRGCGRRLLAAVARIALERGCGRLEWAVLDWNEPALRFYRRLGARAMDEWTVYRVTNEALCRLAASEERD